MTRAPVTEDTTGISGVRKSSPASTSRKGSRTGSMWWEWNACGTARRCAWATRCEISRTASASPASTTEAGPFTAASATRSSRPRSSSGTSASGTGTATIAPSPPSSRISRPRAATSAQASASENTPAACAAASSPTECPATASGRTPSVVSSRNTATCTANTAACAWSVRSPGPSRRISASGRSSSGSSSAAISWRAAANAGTRSRSDVAMSAYCTPWPGNRNAVAPSAAAPVMPVPARSAAVSSPVSVPSTTVRARSRARVVASEYATSSADGEPFPSSSVSRPSFSRRSRASACAGSASGVAAESTHGISGGAAAVAGSGSGSGSGSSRITCALVPLRLNEDTAARRGRSTRGQSTGSSSSRTAPSSQFTCGLGAFECRVAGNRPCRMASTILSTPAKPAAAWVCPRLDFADPTSTGRSRSCP